MPRGGNTPLEGFKRIVTDDDEQKLGRSPLRNMAENELEKLVV